MIPDHRRRLLSREQKMKEDLGLPVSHSAESTNEPPELHGPAMSRAPATYPQLRAAMSAVIAQRDELLSALKAVTAYMDRAGGDPSGMPECPWCKAGPDGDDHRSECELAAARAAIAKAEGR